MSFTAEPDDTVPILLRRILENLDAFRAGTLSVLDLAQNLYATANALEGDVSLDVRDAIRVGANDLELEAFTSNSAERAQVVIDRIDAAVRSRHLI